MRPMSSSRCDGFSSARHIRVPLVFSRFMCATPSRIYTTSEPKTHNQIPKYEKIYANLMCSSQMACFPNSSESPSGGMYFLPIRSRARTHTEGSFSATNSNNDVINKHLIGRSLSVSFSACGALLLFDLFLFCSVFVASYVRSECTTFLFAHIRWINHTLV